MIGCLIGLAGMGSAVAADCGAHDVAAIGRPTTDGSSRDAGGGNGGDTLGLNRDGSSSRRASDADSSGSDADVHGTGVVAGGERGGRGSAPAEAQPATLGWQSLLPGSIQ
jgi:hypothetical protein